MEGTAHNIERPWPLRAVAECHPLWHGMDEEHLPLITNEDVLD